MSAPADPVANPSTSSPKASSEAITIQHQVTRSAGIVSLAVLGSRLMGLVREQVFAYFFGASRAYDAFQTAFRIPNMLRDLFAEGALSHAFVTTFSQYLTTKNEAAAWRLANLVLNGLIVILSLITLVGIWLAPQLVELIAPGFAAFPGKVELTTELTRIMYPFIILVAMAAVAMGILNTKHRFALPASASTFFNIGSIVAGLTLAYWLDPTFGPQAMVGMALGTLIGGALQFLVQVPSLYRVGFRYQPIISFSDPGVRHVISLMGPAIIGASAVQINVLVNNNFASPMEGAVSWLNYAFRLMYLPIGLFGVAIGTAALPNIARAAARQDQHEFRQTLASALGLVFFLCIPSACGLILLREPIIRLIYEQGRFSAFDTHQTAGALAFYALGLAGYAAIRVLAPAFVALNDARTPMLISLASIFTNYLLNSLLVTRLGHRGLALSTSLVALTNFLALFLLMRRRLQRIEGRAILRSLVKVLTASLVMSAACWWSYHRLVGWWGYAGLWTQLVDVFIPMSVGVLVFLLACRLLHVDELNMAWRAFWRRASSRQATAPPQPPTDAH